MFHFSLWPVVNTWPTFQIVALSFDFHLEIPISPVWGFILKHNWKDYAIPFHTKFMCFFLSIKENIWGAYSWELLKISRFIVFKKYIKNRWIHILTLFFLPAKFQFKYLKNFERAFWNGPNWNSIFCAFLKLSIPSNALHIEKLLFFVVENVANHFANSLSTFVGIKNSIIFGKRQIFPKI